MNAVDCVIRNYVRGEQVDFNLVEVDTFRAILKAEEAATFIKPSTFVGKEEFFSGHWLGEEVEVWVEFTPEREEVDQEHLAYTGEVEWVTRPHYVGVWIKRGGAVYRDARSLLGFTLDRTSRVPWYAVFLTAAAAQRLRRRRERVLQSIANAILSEAKK